ncbi:hypothetical protein [Thaumasiovibrio subtropicus]|uniref:hypothetical protein n=1 Tax=Thaumasiovibrio subtropicus TaxID=1891207 RepID=UPI001863D93C|nr:hypothetical protein [Thaumasiovibrio subtropicus]
MLKSANRVYPSDLAPAGYCCSGGRTFFAGHGLSWADFVKEGIAISELEEINDPIVEDVIAWVRKNRKS